MKEHHRLLILPPGHPDGYHRLWLWQVHSENDIEMAGTSDDRQNAAEAGMLALATVMERKK
jgi:putative IMPACT (imprinted ancient) family translation regulator